MQPNCDYLSISAVQRSIYDRKISPVELVENCLKRIADLNPHLNAFITVLAHEAIEQAKQFELEIKAGTWRGPLHGIPLGVKDFYDTAGVKTTAACHPFRTRVPGTDAVSVAKLKNAGAIIIGKTNMHALGMGTTGLESYFGPVKNPWNADYIPGGSSSGSAVAVATGMCYATLDTDAIGSCRLPAACCGVVGFKGTYGLINTKGILEGEKADEAILWLSHAGITTRSVEDTGILLNALAEPHNDGTIHDFRKEALALPKRLRVGVVARSHADKDLIAAFKAAVEVVRALGHETAAASAPFDMPPFGDVHTIEADRQAVSDRVFKDIDILLLPTTATTVPSVGEASADPQGLSAANTMFANYYGLPAISVPGGFDRRGLPIGLQIVAKPWHDGEMLQLAHQYHARTDGHSQHPTLKQGDASHSNSAREAVLRRCYAAFNARDSDGALAQMHPDVMWPNAWEGGWVKGRDEIRRYWQRQWAELDPHVEPRGFSWDANGRVVVTVHQSVRDLTGTVLSDQMVTHVYKMEDDLVLQMEIRK
jgi:aspartyl-tRNA(Asn)/glutamyl-tRNA(Gln) amidotransferase subunit A